MSCEHASTTTVLWAYGELDDDAHALHVASCPACSAALEALEAAERGVAPVVGALGLEVAPVVEGGAAERARRRAPWGLLALAAALVATLGTALYATRPHADPTEAPQAVDVHVEPAPAPLPAWPDPAALDDELDALELELDSLRSDPSLL